MENVPVFVGLDYHSSAVQVCVVDAAGVVLANRRCANIVEHIAAAIGPGRSVTRAGIESCCGAADLAEALIEQQRWPLSLAHAGYVARVITSIPLAGLFAPAARGSVHSVDE